MIKGPFNAKDWGFGGRFNRIYTVPYAHIKGSQLAVAVIDNFSNLGATGTSLAWGTVEVVIEGYIAGYRYRLKRQQVRSKTGPLVFQVPLDKAFESIGVGVRNISGGVKRFFPADAIQLQVQIYVQPSGKAAISNV